MRYWISGVEYKKGEEESKGGGGGSLVPRRFLLKAVSLCPPLPPPPHPHPHPHPPAPPLPLDEGGGRGPDRFLFFFWAKICCVKRSDPTSSHWYRIVLKRSFFYCNLLATCKQKLLDYSSQLWLRQWATEWGRVNSVKLGKNSNEWRNWRRGTGSRRARNFFFLPQPVFLSAINVVISLFDWFYAVCRIYAARLCFIWSRPRSTGFYWVLLGFT